MTWRGPLHTAALTTLARASGYLAVAILALGALAAPAFGYFVAGGSGLGSHGTGTLQPPTILPATVGAPATSLLPGTSADLLVTVSNPNPGPVTLVSVAQGGGVTVQGGTGCTDDPSWPGTLGNSGVSLPTASALSIPVAGGATVTVHLAAGASMSTASAPGCQGASFQIPVTVVVQQ